MKGQYEVQEQNGMVDKMFGRSIRRTGANRSQDELHGRTALTMSSMQVRLTASKTD